MKIRFTLLLCANASEELSIKQLLANATTNGNDYLLPILDKGVLLAFSEPDKSLVDYEVRQEVTFSVLSPISNYLANLNSLPFSRFCGISESDERKYLHDHISEFKSLWNDNLDGYEPFIDSKRHRRGVIQGTIMLLIAFYHISKYQRQSYENEQFDEHLVELSSKLSDLENDSKNLLMQSQNILSIVQSYWCTVSGKFREIQAEVARQAIRSYISEVHYTLGQAIKNQVPSDPEATSYLTQICENLNTYHSNLCAYSVMKGLESSFRGFTTEIDAFGSTKIQIRMMISVPIYSQNQFAFKITSGNVGYYNNSIRNSVLLPKVSYLLRYNDTNFDRYTPIEIPCNTLNCSPTTLITEMTPNSCLKSILLSSPDVDDKCFTKPVTDHCSGIFLGPQGYLVCGTGLFTPLDESTPISISAPTVVPPGTMTCAGKQIHFHATLITEKRIILNQTSLILNPSDYSNFSDFEIIQNQIVSIQNDLIISVSNQTNISANFHQFRQKFSSGLSNMVIFSLLLTLLGLIYPIFKCSRFFFNLVYRCKTNKKNQSETSKRVVRFDKIEEFPFIPKNKSESSPNLVI